MSVFGKAKYGSGKRNWFKLKDGDSAYRIFPPMGELAEDGRWSFYHKVHYGYKNSKGDMRPFLSPEVKNRKTKMVDVRDAALERLNQLKEKLEAAKKSGNQELVTKIQELYGGKKSRYNLDANHYMIAMDLQGNIGILKIRHKAKLALDATIKRLRDSGVEPLDPETGRFFVFSRSGMGIETTYQVSVYARELDVEGVGKVKQDLVHVITPEIAKRCLVENKDGSFSYKEAARLDSLFRSLTEEEVERIVKEGEKAVDEIFDSKVTAEANTAGYGDDGSDEEEQETTSETVVTAPVLAATPDTKTAVTSTVASEATKVTADVTATAPKTTAQAVSEQSDEDFLKSLGL